MEASLLVDVLVPAALGVIMLALGLGLSVEDFTRVAKVPRAVVVGLGQVDDAHAATAQTADHPVRHAAHARESGPGSADRARRASGEPKGTPPRAWARLRAGVESSS